MNRGLLGWYHMFRILWEIFLFMAEFLVIYFCQGQYKESVLYDTYSNLWKQALRLIKNSLHYVYERNWVLDET